VSLATRCNACGTVFRVVQDQLKVSEGWVRCGRCGDVFNALEGLFDLEGTSGPMALPRESAVPAPALAARVADPPAAVPGGDEPPAPAPQDEPEDDGGAATTAIDTQVDSRTDSGFAAAPADSRYRLDLVDSQVPDEALSAFDAASEPTPSFLRDETRDAQWRRPRVRRALMVLGGLLAVTLALQVVMQRRDEMAARWPAAAPTLAGLCVLFGCTLEAPRALDALAVESSGLTRVEGAPLYRLQVALRNRASTPVLTPALDLTLTDLRGDIVARRVLLAADFGREAPPRLAAGADWSVNALLDLGDARVAGYTVELFYP
jgi:predicted Zn finger-like uncharacterized protein